VEICARSSFSRWARADDLLVASSSVVAESRTYGQIYATVVNGLGEVSISAPIWRTGGSETYHSV
jgi:hypothetical protein